jgi:hypothetical protein
VNAGSAFGRTISEIQACRKVTAKPFDLRIGNHRSLEDLLPARHSAQLDLHLQGPLSKRDPDWSRAGVRCVVEGSMRKVDDRVRITAQLVDATTGTHVSADRYDRDLTQILVVQDEVTRKIVGALMIRLVPGGRRRSEARRCLT